MVISVNNAIYYSKNADLGFDILPRAMVKSLKIGNKFDKKSIKYHVGIKEIANQVRGATVGDQEVSISMDMPQAMFMELAANYYAAYGIEIEEGTFPIVGVLNMIGDEKDLIKRELSRMIVQFEFVVQETSDLGIESGSTDERFVSLTCIGTKKPNRFIGGRRF